MIKLANDLSEMTGGKYSLKQSGSKSPLLISVNNINVQLVGTELLNGEDIISISFALILIEFAKIKF